MNMRTGVLLAVLMGTVLRPGMAQEAPPPQASAAAAATQPAELTLDLGDGVTMKLVRIPAGRFLIGCPASEKGRTGDEQLLSYSSLEDGRVPVELPRPFYMGVCEVTVAQYGRFVKETGRSHEEPEVAQSPGHPVGNVSWLDATAFCEWLSRKSGRKVQLPTEVQWEYACRAGTQTRFTFGDSDADLGDYAWFAGNSADGKGARSAHPVGLKKPNAWGLHDVHGNVWEWCRNWYGSHYQTGVPDPVEYKFAQLRAIRGGSYRSKPDDSRSALRNGEPLAYYHDSIGFRVMVTEPEN